MKAQRLILTLLCIALNLKAANAQTPETNHAQTFERTVHVAPFGPDGSRYFYVPFDVPRGASRVRVAYEYAREGGANTIDVGVFDSRFGGADTDPRGFRGWSGGRRSEFFIARALATPGYLAGELPAGRWRVVLGLYKIAPAGVDVKVKISVELGGAAAGRAASRAADAHRKRRPGRPIEERFDGRGPHWWSGDLHTHTVHSDGEWTVPGLAKAASEAGLDFLFVTDHNTSSHHAEVEFENRVWDLPLVLRGEEITTYGGHTNAWGLPSGGWVDFRVRPGDNASIAKVAARAHGLGALISINHPFAACGGCDWSYKEALKDFDAVEVWNGAWDATDELALGMWDGLLQRGLRPTAVASSDTHREQNPVGRPTTHVAAEALSQAALLRAVKRGRAYLTAEPGRPVVSFEAWTPGGVAHARTLPGDVLRLAAHGTLLFFIGIRDAPSGATASLVSGGRVIRSVPFDQGPDAVPTKVEVECRGDGYYRLEVRDKDGAMLALTNPVYVKVGGRRSGLRARDGSASSRPR